MASGPTRRVLASVLFVATLTAAVPPNAVAGGGAVFRGRVLNADGITPRSGVIVTLVDQRGEAVVRSGTSDEGGAFRIDSAPAGSYAVIANTPEGAFLASAAVTLRPGDNAPVGLSLQQTPPTTPPSPPPPPPAGETTTTTTTTRLVPWQKWALVGVIVVSSLFLIDQLSEDEATASAF